MPTSGRHRAGDEHRDACLPDTHTKRLIAAPVAARASLERKNPPNWRAFASTATGIRTPVSAVRGRCPSPLDDGGASAARIAKGFAGGLGGATTPRVGRGTVYLRF